MYAHGRDKQMRPIIYINTKMLASLEMDTDDLIGMTDYLHSYVVYNAMVPGSIEQWVTIWDCEDVALTDVPAPLLYRMVTHGTFAFKQRNAMTFYLQLPWMVRVAFAIGQSFLDQF